MVIPQQALTAMKVAAVLLMTLDHIDFFLLGARAGISASVGRLAMPLFVFVLAYNLCSGVRTGTQTVQQRQARASRVIRRLLLWGLVATPAFTWLRMHGASAAESAGTQSAMTALFPLNILFSLAVCVRGWMVVDGLSTLGQRFALKQLPGDMLARLLLGTMYALEALLLLFAGFLIEYHWWVMLVFASACWLIRADSLWSLAAFGISLLLLYPFADSLWAVGTLAAVAAAQWAGAPAGGTCKVFAAPPRWAFYAYYPVHLTALAVVARIALR